MKKVAEIQTYVRYSVGFSIIKVVLVPLESSTIMWVSEKSGE